MKTWSSWHSWLRVTRSTCRNGWGSSTPTKVCCFCSGWPWRGRHATSRFRRSTTRSTSALTSTTSCWCRCAWWCCPTSCRRVPPWLTPSSLHSWSSLQPLPSVCSLCPRWAPSLSLSRCHILSLSFSLALSSFSLSPSLPSLSPLPFSFFSYTIPLFSSSSTFLFLSLLVFFSFTFFFSRSFFLSLSSFTLAPVSLLSILEHVCFFLWRFHGWFLFCSYCIFLFVSAGSLERNIKFLFFIFFCFTFSFLLFPFFLSMALFLSLFLPYGHTDPHVRTLDNFTSRCFLRSLLFVIENLCSEFSSLNKTYCLFTMKDRSFFLSLAGRTKHNTTKNKTNT